MDNDSRTMMMGMTLNRNEHLKGLSLQQSENSLFTKLPRELIYKDIFSFLLPQQLIQNFLEARIKSDEYFSEKMLLAPFPFNFDRL